MYYTAFVPFQELFCEYTESHQKHDMQVLQYHDTYEIYLQTHGKRYLFIDGLCYVLNPMDFYVIKPYEMHYCQSMSSEYYGRYVTNFADDKLQFLLTPSECSLLLHKLSSGVYHLDEQNFLRMKNIFRELSLCCQREGFFNEKLKYTLIFQLLLFVCEAEKSKLPAQNTLPQMHPEILAAVNYINMHYRAPLSLEDITQEIHMSKYYFCRKFKEATGVTFVEYINNVRIAKAHRLLLETNLSLSKIAKMTGFSSGMQLTRVFRSFYQCTPSAFRKQLRE